MAPNQGLVHLKEYDIKDSNVELIGSEIDHQVKYRSAATEPAWNDGRVGVEPGLQVWRIEDFEVVPWPREKHGQFMDGDSYIVLHSYSVGKADEDEDEETRRKKLFHEIFFWLGAHTSQDEAGTAAYKTVELDEFLGGRATQHRELQQSPSDDFVALFPRITIRSGGVRSGFRHVDVEAEEERRRASRGPTLLRVFKLDAVGTGRSGGSVVVHEVPPAASSLDEDDVFVLDVGDKIWVWQGKGCSPMEKAKAAQVVHDMTLAKHVEVEVLAQAEPRSRVIVGLLSRDDAGGDDAAPSSAEFHQSRPLGPRTKKAPQQRQQHRPRRLYRLSDASGTLSLTLVKTGGDGAGSISRDHLVGDDIFLLDDQGRAIWVWEGQSASRSERAAWLRVAQQYVREVLAEDASDDKWLTPIAKVVQGAESPAFLRALGVAG